MKILAELNSPDNRGPRSNLTGRREREFNEPSARSWVPAPNPWRFSTPSDWSFNYSRYSVTALFPFPLSYIPGIPKRTPASVVHGKRYAKWRSYRGGFWLCGCVATLIIKMYNGIEIVSLSINARGMDEADATRHVHPMREGLEARHRQIQFNSPEVLICVFESRYSSIIAPPHRWYSKAVLSGIDKCTAWNTKPWNLWSSMIGDIQ